MAELTVVSTDISGHQLQGRELACRSRGLSTVYNSRWHPWVLGVKQVERMERANL